MAEVVVDPWEGRGFAAAVAAAAEGDARPADGVVGSTGTKNFHSLVSFAVWHLNL